MRTVSKSPRSSLLASVVLVCVAAFGLVSCQPRFVPTPCASSLYQGTSTFADGQSIVNDCEITIHSEADVAARREQLIQFIWGDSAFPSSKLPASVDRNAPSPVPGLTNLDRVDTLHIAMDAGQVGIAHHFIPLHHRANRLVVLHQGHACTFNDSAALTDDGYGMQRTINSLLADGYSVLAVYMQHIDDQLPGVCGQPSHDEMFETLHTEGSPMKFFLEPVAVSLNYLQTRSGADQFPVYRDFSMVGLSGGGWTTVVYAAIDARIRLSFPVAGSLPLYLRFPASEGDTEQNLTAFYALAGYPDLHVMGASGAARRQVQVLNRRDDCCFAEQFHDPDLTGMSFDRATRSYEWRVRGTISALPAGSFRLEMDEVAPAHMISWSNIASVILAELNEDRRTVGAGSATDAFVRGVNGNLLHFGPSGWQDTGLAMVGAPAAVGGGDAPLNVFYRDTSNRLMRAVNAANGWTSAYMGAIVISDPVAASTGPGRFDVVALSVDYTPHHWWWNGSSLSNEQLGATRGLGQPALLATPGRIDIFVKGFDRAIYHVRKNGGGVVEELVGGDASGFPTAVAIPAIAGTARQVFVRGLDNRIWSASSFNDGPWQWDAVAPTGMTDGFAGSPAASVSGSAVIVHARTSSGTLGTLRHTRSTGWSYTNVGGAIVDSPTSLGDDAYAHGKDGTLHFFDGTSWHSEGGRFD